LSSLESGNHQNVAGQIIEQINGITAHNHSSDSLEVINDSLRNNKILLIEQIDAHNNNTYRFFFTIERSLSAFTLYNPAEPILPNKYTDTTFDGYSAKLNLNISLGTNDIIGVSYGKSLVNNVSKLKAITISTETAFTDSNRTDKITDNINALKGLYLTYTTEPLQADFVHFFKLEKNMLALNVYWRSYFNENGDNLPKTTHNVGIGTYFFNPENSKFVGGIFLELPDIGNTAEEDKLPSERRNFYQRLSFGIVAKFNFIKYDFNEILHGY
jgi:hypothetical protein